MEVVYLGAALEDMGWFRHYYAIAFPEGRGNARESLLRTERLIAENPLIGHPAGEGDGVREFPLRRTPFGFLYRIQGDRIKMLRLFDHRSFSPNVSTDDLLDE